MTGQQPTSRRVESFDPQLTAPGSMKALQRYIETYLGLHVPSKRLCEGHRSPMDYLWYAYSGDMRGIRNRSKGKIGDCIVWANRGGGKTLLAAVLTLLDSLFKPGCETRILGGSGEQARRMYEYLAHFISGAFTAQIEGALLKTRCLFKNGSRVEVLTQSTTSVRGQHVQKLRCDELELFDADVFSAAHFTTHSTETIRAAMELLSTMHRPYGLMRKVVRQAAERGTPVFQWCVWEVIEKCVGRSCSQCPLWSDCKGKAKKGSGHLRVDDVIAQMKRASRAGWESEMLCLRPSLENIVFAEFDPDVHVKPIDLDANLPLYRSIDFGYVNPFVCLWIQVARDGTVRVIDEYVQSRCLLAANAGEVLARTGVSEEKVAATFCDPSGGARNAMTGTSEIKELRNCGIRARGRSTRILDGVEKIRASIRGGDGSSSFLVSPRCPRLIEALSCYHYPDDPAVPTETPFKDGLYDHPIDALRYFFVNYQPSGRTKYRRY